MTSPVTSLDDALAQAQATIAAAQQAAHDAAAVPAADPALADQVAQLRDAQANLADEVANLPVPVETDLAPVLERIDSLASTVQGLTEQVQAAPAVAPTDPVTVEGDPVTAPANLKPGWQTTEFWATTLTVLGAVCPAVRELLKGYDVNVVAASLAVLAGVVVSVYTVTRAHLKATSIKVTQEQTALKARVALAQQPSGTVTAPSPSATSNVTAADPAATGTAG